MNNVLAVTDEKTPAVKPTLVDVVTDILTVHGYPAAQTWAGELPTDARHEDVGVQQFHLSRYWSLVLAEMPQDTRFERFCLNGARTVKEWLTCFEEGVVKKHLIEKVSVGKTVGVPADVA